MIEQLKLLEKYQEKKFDEMSQLLQQMNVSNGGKFPNPLIIPVENESPNIKTNISMNMKDININDDDKKIINSLFCCVCFALLFNFFCLNF